MKQVARNETMEAWGFLKPGQYLIHDRDDKYCPTFQDIIDNSGVKRVPLPPRSPNLDAFAERWVRSVKSEALSKLILFGERSLRHTLTQYTNHFHQERPHQGIRNRIPFPEGQPANDREGPIHCRERLGGLLKFYDRKAA
jgi:transposase InsO family protein